MFKPLGVVKLVVGPFPPKTKRYPPSASAPKLLRGDGRVPPAFTRDQSIIPCTKRNHVANFRSTGSNTSLSICAQPPMMNRKTDIASLLRNAAPEVNPLLYINECMCKLYRKNVEIKRM